MGWLNINGNWIGRNRGSGSWSSYWTRLPAAKALIDRMIALGEEPTDLQKYNIALTIKALQDACLWDRRWDCLYVCRGYGEASTKLNWIKDAHNLTEEGTLVYADGVGFKSNGSTGYLKTNYTPSTEGVNLSQYDAGAFCKIGGSLGTGYRAVFGASNTNTTNDIMLGHNGATKLNYLLTSSKNGNELPAIGYNGLTRLSVTEFKELKGANIYTIAGTQGAYTTKSIYLLAMHYYDDTTAFIAESTVIMEVAAFGGYYSQAEFLKLQEIFNGYISRL